MDENEKHNLRKLLISNFNEPVNQIAMQLAVLISKAARYDCPRDWPELIPVLLEAVKSKDELIQHRALLTLHHVIKSLSSKRLAGDRRIFQELSSNIFSFVLTLWNAHMEALIQGHGNFQVFLEKASLSLKILRKLVVHGFKEPKKVADAMTFLKSLFTRLRIMLECRIRLQGDNQLNECSERYIVLLTKVLTDVLENHPMSFIEFIKPSLEFSLTYLFTEEGKKKLFERFTIRCLNLIKKIVMCAEYRPAKPIEATQEPATLEAHRLKLEFFTSLTLVEMCRQIVSDYFLLTCEDLATWNSDPEEFVNDEGGEAWKFSLRPCIENLFLTLFREFRHTLNPVLLEMIKLNVAPCDPLDMKQILSKDAVYNAVGLAAFDLFDEVNFDQWFVSILRKELEIKEPSYKVIRRRVVWLIGQWAGIKLSGELRPVLYETTLPLLSSEEDLVVRLEAAAALKAAVDDFDFNTEQFAPFLEPAFRLLYQLLQHVSEGDTKMKVLSVISFVIERVRLAVQPYADNLIQYLPHLWNESADHNMLRCAILTVLMHLVQGLGAASEKLYPFLTVVIQLSTDVSQPPSVYLLEDGLILWLVTLENAPKLNPGLLQLYPNIIPILDYSSENLRTCLKIIQAYVLLEPREFLQNISDTLISTCCNLLPELRPEGITTIMKLLEIILKTLPEEGSLLLRPLLPQILKTIADGQEFPVVMSMYLCVAVRVLINNQTIFKNNLEIVAKEAGEIPEKTLQRILDVWVEKMPLVTQSERQKLLALGLTSLITWPTSVVNNRICGILLAVVEVLNDIMKTDDLSAQIDSLVLTSEHDDYSYDNFREDEPETEHQRRKKQLSYRDPVHTVILKDYLRSQLMQLQQSLGPQGFEQLMQTVDIETMQQLQEHLRSL